MYIYKEREGGINRSDISWQQKKQKTYEGEKTMTEKKKKKKTPQQFFWVNGFFLLSSINIYAYMCVCVCVCVCVL